MGPEDRWSDVADTQSMSVSRQQPRSWQAGPRAAVAVLFLFPFFEYLRLHEIVPILDILKVQTVISVALLLIVIAETAKRGVRLSRQSVLLLGFLGLTVFAILPAMNQFRAYQFAYGLTLTLIANFAITHILRNKRDLRRFLSVLLGIHVYLAVKGIRGCSQTTFDPYGCASTGKVGGYISGDENDLALAMGKRVVAIPESCQGLRVSPGLRLLVGDDADRFATRAVELLGDPAQRQRLGAAGRDLVVQQYSCSAMGQQFEALLESVVHRGAGDRGWYGAGSGACAGGMVDSFAGASQSFRGRPRP